MPPLSHTNRSALVSGLSQGFLLPFCGCVAVASLAPSITVIITAVLALSLAGATVLAIARNFSEKEELNEFDRNTVRKEFDKEQRILTKIGIPQQILEPMQAEMNEEHNQRISRLQAAPHTIRTYKASFYLFAGYLVSGLATALFIYISDAHLVISGTMVLGVKFSADLYKNSKIAANPYPMLRSLFNILIAAIFFVAVYMLFKSVIV